jgi:sortase (surface protein transpeptidase)
MAERPGGGEVQRMRAGKLSLYFFALIIALFLAGCGLPPTSQHALPHASPPAAHHAISSTPTPRPKVKANPVRLLIPALGVNAPIEMVGVTSNGDLAVPKQNAWEDVGWYGSGPRPGERGSAVIDGHVDRPGGYPAVFWRLRNIHVGEEVMVTDAYGKSLRFHVTGIAFYPPQDAPIQQIFGNETGTYLNLITCAGAWIPSQHQTSLRLVVYTSLG